MSEQDRSWLARLIAGESLSRSEVAELFGRLMDGELEQPLQAALLVALAAKGETVDEISGAAEAMRARVRRVEHPFPDAVDTCGTGGDESGSFNLSTAAAIVTAAAGAVVAKHGNRAVSSASGSADVLEALGVRVETTPGEAARALEERGIAFLFAPAFHPAMRVVMPVRRALGVRTLFNLLGPLTNPAGVTRQVVGVYALDRVEPVGEVLHGLGTRHALVVHSLDGLDEISSSAPTRVAEVVPEGVTVDEIVPEEFGIERSEPGALEGGGPQENAERMRRLFAGEMGPLADAVALNAGAVLYVADRVETMSEGIERARRVLTDGRAQAKLDEMRGG